MSLRKTPGAMQQYQRSYSRLRQFSADERRAIAAAMESAEAAKCRCQTCDLLRALATIRRAGRNGALDLSVEESHG